jgi:hypothetical protein
MDLTSVDHIITYILLISLRQKLLNKRCRYVRSARSVLTFRKYVGTLMMPSRRSLCHLVEVHTMCGSVVSCFRTLDSRQASRTNKARMAHYSDSLRAGRSGDRIPLRASFSTPVQTDPRAHLATYTIGAGLFPGAKRPGSGVDNPPPSRAPRLGLRVKL